MPGLSYGGTAWEAVCFRQSLLGFSLSSDITEERGVGLPPVPELGLSRIPSRWTCSAWAERPSSMRSSANSNRAGKRSANPQRLAQRGFCLIVLAEPAIGKSQCPVANTLMTGRLSQLYRLQHKSPCLSKLVLFAVRPT